MDELLNLLERYVSGYRRLIQGAQNWRVKELEETFGRPLPEFYQEFARTMGLSGGPLLANVDGYEPTQVAEHYRFASMEMPPRRFLFVFGDPSLDDAHYWLDLEARSEDGDCQVVRMPFGESAWETELVRYHLSLKEMLFVWAMENVCLPVFPFQAGYFVTPSQFVAGGGSEVEELAGRFEQLGFRRLSYPRYCLLLEREDAALEIVRRPGRSGCWFRIGGREQMEFKRFQAIVEDMEGVERI